MAAASHPPWLGVLLLAAAGAILLLVPGVHVMPKADVLLLQCLWRREGRELLILPRG